MFFFVLFFVKCQLESKKDNECINTFESCYGTDILKLIIDLLTFSITRNHYPMCGCYVQLMVYKMILSINYTKLIILIVLSTCIRKLYIANKASDLTNNHV